jgi:hypothetical protein
MTNQKRILIGIAVLVIIIGAVLGLDLLRRKRAASQTGDQPAGSVPIYLDDELLAWFQPQDLEKLDQVSFVDQENGKTQEGWMLADTLALHLDPETMAPETQIVVSSSSRGKSAELSWAEVEQESNLVMFDLSGRGTLKLVSKLEKLDTRDEWVQDVDRIEVVTP